MEKRSNEGSRRSLFLSLFVLGLVTVIAVLPYQFGSKAAGKKGLVQRTESADPGLPNYDIRTAKGNDLADYFESARSSIGKSAVAVADIRDGFVRGEEALRSRVPDVKFEYNEDIRIPEVITPDVWKANIDRLTGPSNAKRSEILRSFVKENNDLVGVTDEQADALRVLADYTNPDGNLSFAHLEQRPNGIPVFRSEVKAGFTKDGRIIRVINNLAPGLDYGSLSTDFRDPLDAVKAAAKFINHELKSTDVTRNDKASNDLKTVFGSGDWATTAEKMYFPTEPGVAVPAWRVLIWEPKNAYYVVVDANTGTMLWRKNITEDQTQTATYQVYNNTNGYINAADSPAPLSPGPLDPTLGTQGPLGTRTNVTLIGNEAPNTFNNNGWITDGANITDGNANEAGIDRDGINGVDAPQTGAPNRVFDSTWNPPPGSPAPGDDPLTPQAQRGAVIQMFYVMNRYHDELYKRGFNEAAFNFQNTNFTGMGLGNDRVSSEGQDSSGTNNANFSTPADGGRGRMQMFVWTGPTPDYDGTADAEVIIHEVTHGTSNRLHGNTAGLSTNMSRGMGEGWGDWYAYTMLAEPTDPINGIYTTGGYATYLIAAGFTGNYYYGIRRFPRAPITFLGPNGKPHNPFTFQYINANCNTLIGTTTSNPPPNSAYPRGPVGVTTCDQVHNIGEIWSSMLWEIRNRMVTRLGFTAGTTRVLQVVTDGMKLAPVGPTILQERDAIIAAASALPFAPDASLDVQDVREGFRVRGAGFSASIQNAGTGANNTVVTEAFDLANAAVTSPFSVSDSTGDNDGIPEPGENLLLSVAVTNTTGGPVNNVMAAVTGGGTGNYGNIADGATVTRQIAYTVPGGAACGSLHDVTITVSSSIGTNSPVIRSFRLGAPVFGVGTTENFDGVTAPALPNLWTQTNSGAQTPWVTTTVGPDTAPNSAFGNDGASPGDSSLITPLIQVNSAAASMMFRRNYSFEAPDWDAMVLEISVAGGAFQDIIAAGGSFVTGGYTGTVNTTAGNPLAGRMAWIGSSGGYGTTTVNLPASANGQVVTLRWRIATDAAVGGTGANIDTVSITGGVFQSGYTCSLAPTVKSRADFDGDGKTDLSVFRPSEGNWYLNRSTAGFSIVNWGLSTDITTPGDFDGDGKADTAIFRPSSGAWFVLKSSGGFTGTAFGSSGDVPVVGDYDGDNKADIAVFRPSTTVWYILNSGGPTTITAFGAGGDVPVRGDYDGDGKTDIAVYRPSTGQWWILKSTGGVSVFTFGNSTDKPVPADYDGDNKDDVAIYRPSTGTWYIQRSSDAGFTINAFGISTDVPVPGDYDGDGRDDQAVYRNGTWYLNRSTSGLAISAFGLGSDIPVPSNYIP
jgi:hypothetical protein